MIRKIFNSILEQNTFPPQWSEYITILIPKPGNKGYRPIALAPNLLKLLEKIIKKRLDWYVENDYIISPSQFGFRKQKSTQDSTTLLVSKAYLSLSKKQVFAFPMLDIEGAFDNVDPNTLIQDLIELKIGSKTTAFIQEIVSFRNISFYLKKKHIEDKPTTKGFPQGSVLSPILFNIYVRKIFCNMGQCSNFQIAEAIKEDANQLSHWLKQRGLNIAPHKYQFILINNRRKSLKHIKIQIDKTDIFAADQVKFLGVIFDSELRWLPHIKDIKNRAMSTLNILKAFSNKKFGVKPPLLLNTYKALTRSILEWGFSS
ncbi:hypothetical protein TSAR_013117 [Trichomalopsis sarcophagae]|uniref:Reverse transcriptase domain-containing protein n=1 Tax=Trichomalopsis sarcophagae TaxID=543379 RepID=A0A232ERF1_9HYME|nr:hypothetical protein TSAR_013117 [Trichomalopsis sarcophagae]